MDIDKLTIGEAKELAAMFGGKRGSAHPYPIGMDYIFRTVTMFVVGHIVAVYDHEIELRDASWVADSGRWHEALRDGTLSEVEPCPDGPWIVGRGAIVDAGPWNHPLPRVQK